MGRSRRAASPRLERVLTTFEFEFEPRVARWGRLFGIRPDRTAVHVDGPELRIDFGPWKLRTQLANVAGTEITGPYTLWKVAGPPHLSFADRGITLATTTRRGVCIRFLTPVPALLPLRRLAHPAATVTAADPDGLLAALSH